MPMRIAHWPPVLLASLAGSACALGAGPFPASFNLSSLDGRNGFVINGIDTNDNSGWAVSSAGDVNGDGVDDILIGARNAAPNGQNYAGESYVVFGMDTSIAGPFAASINLSALNGITGFVISGVDAGDFSGSSVSSAGDVNGDGVDDLVIGAWGADPSGKSTAGETYVVFGKHTAVAGPFDASVNLAAIDGTTGFVIRGIEGLDTSGISVSCAGDVNGDGIDDILIGAKGGDPNGQPYAGETYVVFGGPGLGASGILDLSPLTNGTAGFVVNGIDTFDYSGTSVSSAGDVNGDGIADILIGAWAADPNGQGQAGESYVVFGKDTSVSSPFAASINLSSLSGASGFVLNGIDAAGYSGNSVSSAGDVNGDGVGDIIIGARNATANAQYAAGESYVVFGRDTSVAGPFAASINLFALDGTTGFVLNGIDAYDASGWSVSAAGDVNGDGVDDVLIGARRADTAAHYDAGECYVVFGKVTAVVGPFEASISLAALDGITGFVLNGIDVADRSGVSVSAAGDVNGDGIDDILIGAKDADPNGHSDAGECYVVFGRTPAFCIGDVSGNGSTTVLDFNILAAWFGETVPPGTNGDLTGDGFVDTADFNILAGNFGCGAE